MVLFDFAVFLIAIRVILFFVFAFYILQFVNLLYEKKFNALNCLMTFVSVTSFALSMSISYKDTTPKEASKMLTPKEFFDDCKKNSSTLTYNEILMSCTNILDSYIPVYNNLNEKQVNKV